MATIVDVAHAAGVSRGTASNVFAHPERVSEALRQRVMDAAAALGYAGPNPRVRFLKGGKLNAIGVTPAGDYGVRAAFANPYSREFLSGVAEVCDKRGASLTVVGGAGEDTTWGVRNAVVDGFIVHRFEEASVLAARRRKLPCVLVDMDGDAETSSVRVDDRGGARQAALHLVDLGHTRFVIFSVLRDAKAGPGPVYHEPGRGHRHWTLSGNFPLDRDRIAGYCDALATIGVHLDDVPVFETWADVVESTRTAAESLLDTLPEVTAVLATTDVQALAVLEAAHRRGIRVPDDLSVVGFDDIPESAGSTPPLTTITHPMVEKGRTAARLLFAEKTGEHVVLPVNLNLRSSTAPPPWASATSSPPPIPTLARRS